MYIYIYIYMRETEGATEQVVLKRVYMDTYLYIYINR